MKRMMMMLVVAAVGAPGCDEDEGGTSDADATTATETSATTTTPDTIDEVEGDVADDTTAPETSDDDTAAEVEGDVGDGDDGEVSEPPAEPIEVAGQWSSGFGDEWIWGGHWDNFCLNVIASADNTTNVAVLETVGGQDCVPGFSRVIWNEIAQDTLAYCTTAYGQATAAAAAAAPEVDIDRQDLVDGCGGFPWSTLERQTIEVLGEWTSPFGDESITATAWDGYCEQLIARVDDADNIAVLETVGGAGCGTGFNRVVWIEPTNDSFAYCTTVFGLTSVEAAWSAPETNIDREDLETGCGGFPWSTLTRVTE